MLQAKKHRCVTLVVPKSEPHQHGAIGQVDCGDHPRVAVCSRHYRHLGGSFLTGVCYWDWVTLKPLNRC